MQPRLTLGRQLADKLAVDILDPCDHLLGLVGQCIPELRSLRRILSSETSIGPASTRIAAPTNHIHGVKERNLFADVFRFKLPQAGHIARPQTATVGCHDDLSVLRMDRHIMDRDRRQALIELSPVLTSIDGNPKGEFGTQVQKVWIDQILSQTACGSPRQTGVKGIERIAEIFGDKHIRIIVIRAVTIQTDVHATLEVSRGFDRRDETRTWYLQIRCDVLPICPTIASDPNRSVVGSCIQHIRIPRGLRNSCR